MKGTRFLLLSAGRLSQTWDIISKVLFIRVVTVTLFKRRVGFEYDLKIHKPRLCDVGTKTFWYLHQHYSYK